MPMPGPTAMNVFSLLAYCTNAGVNPAATGVKGTITDCTAAIDAWLTDASASPGCIAYVDPPGSGKHYWTSGGHSVGSYVSVLGATSMFGPLGPSAFKLFPSPSTSAGTYPTAVFGSAAWFGGGGSDTGIRFEGVSIDVNGVPGVHGIASSGTRTFMIRCNVVNLGGDVNSPFTWDNLAPYNLSPLQPAPLASVTPSAGSGFVISGTPASSDALAVPAGATTVTSKLSGALSVIHGTPFTLSLTTPVTLASNQKIYALTASGTLNGKLAVPITVPTGGTGTSFSGCTVPAADGGGGFTLSAGAPASTAVPGLSAAGAGIVQACIVEECRAVNSFGAGFAYFQNGFWFAPQTGVGTCTDNHLVRCLANSTGGDGIHLDSCPDMWVEDNDITDSAGINAIYAATTGGLRILDCTVENFGAAHAAGSTYVGINIAGSDDAADSVYLGATVRGNFVHTDETLGSGNATLAAPTAAAVLSATVAHGATSIPSASLTGITGTWPSGGGVLLAVDSTGLLQSLTYTAYSAGSGFTGVSAWSGTGTLPSGSALGLKSGLGYGSLTAFCVNGAVLNLSSVAGGWPASGDGVAVPVVAGGVVVLGFTTPTTSSVTLTGTNTPAVSTSLVNSAVSVYVAGPASCGATLANPTATASLTAIVSHGSASIPAASLTGITGTWPTGGGTILAVDSNGNVQSLTYTAYSSGSGFSGISGWVLSGQLSIGAALGLKSGLGYGSPVAFCGVAGAVLKISSASGLWPSSGGLSVPTQSGGDITLGFSAATSTTVTLVGVTGNTQNGTATTLSSSAVAVTVTGSANYVYCQVVVPASLVAPGYVWFDDNAWHRDAGGGSGTAISGGSITYYLNSGTSNRGLSITLGSGEQIYGPPTAPVIGGSGTGTITVTSPLGVATATAGGVTGTPLVQMGPAKFVSVPVAGKTTATAGTSLAGATASGAPTSYPAGTFTVGDFVIDQTGKIWIYNGTTFIAV
jgi:hypothetical protein